MGNHTVRQGESVQSIAMSYRLPWKKIWQHSANRDLRTKRKDHNILFPGDQIYVPDKERKNESGITEKRHRFVAKGMCARLRVRILVNDRPRALESYELNVDGIVQSGRTDGEGCVDHPIKPNAAQAVLTFSDGCQHVFRLGHLDPIDETQGIQGRLKGLGYYAGSIDGHAGSATRDAIKRFQMDKGLRQTGRADPDTKSALRSAFGC